MRKRFRFLAAAAAVAALTMAVPATSQADDPDQTCDNGNEPIVFVHTHENPLLFSNIRVLCVA